MKYNNFKIWIGLLLLVNTIVSCEKQLTDIQPIDQIPSNVAISNMADVQQAVNGVYGTWLGRRNAYLSATISDETRIGTGTEYRNVGNILFNWQHDAASQDWRDGENGGGWTNYYQVIDRANRLLEFLPPVPTLDANEAALKTQIRGEMLALRAIAHFELLRWYGETPEYNPTARGIVVQTEFVKNPGSYRPSRGTQLAAITAINSDLATARTLIPTTFINNSRITRNAVVAIQAKVAAFTKNWQECIDRATEVINLQPVSPRTIYASLWTARTLPQNQNNEVIWKLNVTSANLGANIGSLWQDVGTGAVQATPSSKLLNTYDQVNDIRFSTFFRTVQVNTGGPSRTLIAKYGHVIATPSNGENFQYDIKAIRTSDIMLLRAEAAAQLSQFPLANSSLAAVRVNRITGYTHTDINSTSGLVTEIMQERFKELCFEGHRYFDLKQRNLPINRDAIDVNNVSAIQNLLTNNRLFILPIPTAEFFANPNIGQNPGY